MKKYLLIGVVALLLFTGCGSKNADIVCSGKMTEGNETVEAKYYGYLKDGKVSRIDVEMTFDKEDTAKQTCQMLELVKSMAPEEAKDMKVSCSGKTITVENFPDNSTGEDKMVGATKEEFIKSAEKEGLTCK